MTAFKSVEAVPVDMPQCLSDAIETLESCSQFADLMGSNHHPYWMTLRTDIAYAKANLETLVEQGYAELSRDMNIIREWYGAESIDGLLEQKRRT
jgi:hypothetical protein